MRPPQVCLVAFAASLIMPVGAWAAEAVEPPSATDAPMVVAGEPAHGRVQPIAVLAGHVYALPGLIDGLQDESADTRARCAFLLGQIASKDAVGPLTGALDDNDRDVRMFAGMALARMGDFSGYHAARAAYEGNRWWIRFWAIDALARLDRVPDLALNDPDPLVRAAAVEGGRGGWGPASARVRYIGADDTPLYDLIFGLTNYLVAETDWWWHAGHYEQIIRGNETIVWLDPSYLEGLTNAAYLYWSLDRDVEALATYRRAVAMHPDDWQSHFELGFFYYNAQQRYDDAIPEFERARELGCPPTQARMHAHALEHAGYPAKALEVWRVLAEKNPSDGVARQNMLRLEAIAGSG